MTESVIGTWADAYIHLGEHALHVKDCFHVSCEKNMFYAKRNKQKTITCLKANYIFITLRLQPLFFDLLYLNLQVGDKKMTGKFKTVLKEQSGVRLEQVTDVSRRSRTEEPEELVFCKDTLNPRKLSTGKLKPEELKVKHKRIKLGIRDRRKDLVNLMVLLYAETTDGWVLLSEWTSKNIAVRFGNVADHPDLKGITAKDREREFADLMYDEITQFQNAPSLALLKLCRPSENVYSPKYPSTPMSISPNTIISPVLNQPSPLNLDTFQPDFPKFDGFSKDYLNLYYSPIDIYDGYLVNC
ncbi:hypothetical protein HK103_003079 [Boothiomyces macroporosus]|uniref:Uncharacterized protein n=1 Tax=Boothiomyces macroporosus TaxID=261099 RepID=A0AAD5Y056_9FUNG|nr:hypothetical protein HK103_003079 [Boothiomyces macroporosus]